MILKTVDLFSGIGGIRLGFERACAKADIEHQCVFASDVKKSACKVYRDRFGNSPDPFCDITKVDAKDVPDFDVLLAGFPCQAFSMAGAGLGFEEARGTLFFDLARIVKEKHPTAFLLENVGGLFHHDNQKTIKVIVSVLSGLGYMVECAILNSKNFGVPQNRPRVYIVGFEKDLAGGSFSFPKGRDSSKRLIDILEPSPVDEKYYMSKSYWKTLVERHNRNHAKGSGFGYQIKSPMDVASTLMSGGMGTERNLIKDESNSILPDWANTDRIRVMTPIEWERLQGFDDDWTKAVLRTARMDLLGNSVTVNVIEAISQKIIKELVDRIPACENSIFG
jgi:DNA (cytosine-5)-methyltransferase 1